MPHFHKENKLLNPSKYKISFEVPLQDTKTEGNIPRKEKGTQQTKGSAYSTPLRLMKHTVRRQVFHHPFSITLAHKYNWTDYTE